MTMGGNVDSRTRKSIFDKGMLNNEDYRVILAFNFIQRYLGRQDERSKNIIVHLKANFRQK